MILEQKIKIKLETASVKYYKNLGYEIEYEKRNGNNRIKTKELFVDVFDLPKKSDIQVLVKCDNCGKVFERSYHSAQKSNKQSCSIECMSETKAKEQEEIFSQRVGGNPRAYLYQKYVIDKMTTRQIAKEIYNNEKCYNSVNGWLKKYKVPIRRGSEAIKTQWIDKDERRAKASEKTKETLLRSDVRDRIKETMKTKEYRQKSREAKLGENNPSWKGGITPENVRFRNSDKYKEWRRKVYERDHFTCQVCNEKRSGSFVAHHMNSCDVYKQDRYDIDNGITLCVTCHKEFHSTYGYGNNTKEQFDEFKNSKHLHK
jgi:hypothetical protein